MKGATGSGDPGDVSTGGPEVAEARSEPRERSASGLSERRHLSAVIHLTMDDRWIQNALEESEAGREIPLFG